MCMYMCIFLFDTVSPDKDMIGYTSGCWHWLFKRGGDELGKREKTIILKSYSRQNI